MYRLKILYAEENSVFGCHRRKYFSAVYRDEVSGRELGVIFIDQSIDGVQVNSHIRFLFFGVFYINI